MKEKELREHAICSLCRKLIGHTGLPSFWTATIARHGIIMGAIRRQDGLAVMLDSPRLAQMMGSDPEMTETFLGPITLTICEACAAADITFYQVYSAAVGDGEKET